MQDDANKDVVSVETLAEMTGFPSTLINKELFDGQKLDEDQVDLESLRAAVLKYIDSAMISEDIQS